MAEEFRTESLLEVRVDERSLSTARDTIEEEVGSVSVDVESQGGAAGPGRVMGDGGSMLDDAGMVSMAEERNDYLENILEELEDMVGGGGGGGGGSGGGSGLFGTGVGPNIGLSELAAYSIGTGGSAGIGARLLGRGGASGGASRLGPRAMLGGVTGGLALGFEGGSFLESRGVFEDVEEFGQETGQDSPDWMQTASNFIPGASVAAAGPGLFEAFPGLGSGGDMSGLNRAAGDSAEIWQRRADTLGDIFGTADGAYSQDALGEDERSQVVDLVEENPDRIEEQNRRIAQARDVPEGFDLRDYMNPSDIQVDNGRFGGQTSPAAGRAPPGGPQSSGGDVNVESPIEVNVDSPQDVQQEINRALDQAKREIMQELQRGGVSGLSNSVGEDLQRKFQRGI